MNRAIANVYAVTITHEGGLTQDQKNRVFDLVPPLIAEIERLEALLRSQRQAIGEDLRPVVKLLSEWADSCVVCRGTSRELHAPPAVPYRLYGTCSACGGVIAALDTLRKLAGGGEG
jgi:hypothetical protein